VLTIVLIWRMAKHRQIKMTPNFMQINLYATIKLNVGQ